MDFCHKNSLCVLLPSLAGDKKNYFSLSLYPESFFLIKTFLSLSPIGCRVSLHIFFKQIKSMNENEPRILSLSLLFTDFQFLHIEKRRVYFVLRLKGRENPFFSKSICLFNLLQQFSPSLSLSFNNAASDFLLEQQYRLYAERERECVCCLQHKNEICIHFLLLSLATATRAWREREENIIMHTFEVNAFAIFILLLVSM